MIRIKTRGKKLGVQKNVEMSVMSLLTLINNCGLYNIGSQEALNELIEFVSDNPNNPSDITIYCIAESILNHTSLPYPIEIDELMEFIRNICCNTTYEVFDIVD